MNIEILEGPDWPARLSGDWRLLQKHSATATPFQTWEWHAAWWANYGSPRPWVLTVREGGDLVGFYPMVRGVLGLKPMAAGPSDYLHPLMRTGYEEQVMDLCFDRLQSVEFADLHQISERLTGQGERGIGSGGQADTGPVVLTQSVCLSLDLPATYDDYLAKLGKSLRYDVKKLDRELFASGRAVIRRANAETLESDLDILFEQHRKRWRSRGLPGAFSGRTERFHRRWAMMALDNGWLRLRTLEVDGKPIGSIYAMTFAGTCYYYQAGFDPKHSAISPGTLLVAYTIREAIEEGVARFDFCRGDEPYKRRWQPDHVWQNRRYLFGGGWREDYLLQAWAIEQKIRARLEGGNLWRKRR